MTPETPTERALERLRAARSAVDDTARADHRAGNARALDGLFDAMDALNQSEIVDWIDLSELVDTLHRYVDEEALLGDDEAAPLIEFETLAKAVFRGCQKLVAMAEADQ